MGQKTALKESIRAGTVVEDESGQLVRPLPANDQLSTRSCARCGGLLVNEWYYDSSNAGGDNIESFRCVQCGHRVDPVILQNKIRPSIGSQRVRQERHMHSVKTVVGSGVA